MWTSGFPLVLADILAVIFVVTAIAGIAAARYICERFRQWRHPRRLYRIAAELQLLTGLFLALPEMRIFGIILAGFILFWLTVTLLNHRQWSFAVAGMLMMTALAPASLACTGHPTLVASVNASH